RALNKSGDAVKLKYTDGPHKNKSPGEVLEETLDAANGSPEDLMKVIMEGENLAAKVAAKDPAWTEQAARYLVRTADITGDLALQGEKITEKAMHGFVEVFDLIAATGRNGEDRYQLLLKILKRNAQEEQTTIVKALEDMAAAPKGAFAWDLPPTVRGTAIEARLASTEYKTWSNVGQLNHGYFELFDFNKGSTWVSLKTMDPTSLTAMQRAQAHIDKLGQAVVANSGAVIKLDLRVPPTYAGQLDSLVAYGLAKGVKVEINLFP
ncbi:MAG TPA: hypothetical protein VEC99_02260, partial [Clostridia bacterium]|nr:hypothetical protein [Clostridia bacterium]